MHSVMTGQSHPPVRFYHHFSNIQRVRCETKKQKTQNCILLFNCNATLHWRTPISSFSELGFVNSIFLFFSLCGYSLYGFITLWMVAMVSVLTEHLYNKKKKKYAMFDIYWQVDAHLWCLPLRCLSSCHFGWCGTINIAKIFRKKKIQRTRRLTAYI